MPTLDITPHHSFADWYFSPYNWPGYNPWDNALYLPDYVSAPSSLRMNDRHTTLPWHAQAVRLGAAVLNVLEGQIDTYVKQLYPVVGGFMAIMFGRYGAPPGQFHYLSLLSGASAWWRFRVTWWNSYDLSNDPKLAVKKEMMVAGEWTDLGITYQERLTGATNRVGFVILGDANEWIGCLWDDTYIYF